VVSQAAGGAAAPGGANGGVIRRTSPNPLNSLAALRWDFFNVFIYICNILHILFILLRRPYGINRVELCVLHPVILCNCFFFTVLISNVRVLLL
jgi:ABC-type polysaccharide/polyol phosphate export permease